MGVENILDDLGILKVKILEVFEDLMVCHGFNDSHEERLCEAFNLLEESLCLLSDVSSEAKNGSSFDNVDKATSMSLSQDTSAEIKQEGIQKEELKEDSVTKESSPMKRGHSEVEENEHSSKIQVEDSPPVKRRRGRPRKVDKINVLDRNQTGTKKQLSESEVVTGNEKDVNNSDNNTGDVDSRYLRHTTEQICTDVLPHAAQDTNVDVKSEVKGSVVVNFNICEENRLKRKGRGRPKKETLDSRIEFKVKAPVECENCKKMLCNDAEYEDHVCHTENNSEPTYMCDKCNVIFKTKDVMLNHMSNHKDKTTSSCRLCCKTFKFACLLRMHSHGSQGSFRCKKCDESFIYKKQFDLHMLKHKTQAGTKRMRTSQSSVPFTCPVCNTVIKVACNIKRHLDLHAEKHHVCTVCNKRFSRTDHLQDHMKIHSGIRPRICEFCAKGFLNSSDLKRHLRVHTGIRPYQCTECERSFSQKCSLDKHMRLHEKKPTALKSKKTGSASKPSHKAASYTYKQMMKDLAKTPEQANEQPHTKEELKESSPTEKTNAKTDEMPRNDGKELNSGVAHGPGNQADPDKMRTLKCTTLKRATSKSPSHSTRPQLFTLLTRQPLNTTDVSRAQSVAPLFSFPQDTTVITPSSNAVTYIDKNRPSNVTVTSPNNVYGPSTPSTAQLPSTAPSGGQSAQMLQMEDGSTRIILADSLEVEEEIFLYVDKTPEPVTEGNVEEHKNVTGKSVTPSTKIEEKSANHNVVTEQKIDDDVSTAKS